MLRNKLQGVDQRHREPPHGTSPCMSRLAGFLIRPFLRFLFIPRMTIQTGLRVVSMLSHHLKLANHILIILRTIVAECVFRVKRRSHINAIQPHLMRINHFMPETTFLGTRLRYQLSTHILHRPFIFLLFGLFVDTEIDFPRINTV